jgi:hypothetical protein
MWLAAPPMRSPLACDSVNVFSVVLRKLRSAIRMSCADLILALLTIALTACVRTALWTVHFRTLKRTVDACHPFSLFTGRYTDIQIGRSVRLASRYVPHATCLTQALTAQMLLNWAGIEAKTLIGVRRNEKFEAHAWVECGGRVLVGGAAESATYLPMLTLEGRPPAI